MKTAILATVLFLASPALAQDWTEADKLDAGRCILAESDFRDLAESAAILHVLVKRAKRLHLSIGKMARRYCAIFDQRSYIYGTARLTAIRNATWEAGPGRAWTKRWNNLRAFIDLFAWGEIIDPCPRATIFAGGLDLLDKSGKSRIPKSWKLICTFGPEWAKTYLWEE